MKVYHVFVYEFSQAFHAYANILDEDDCSTPKPISLQRIASRCHCQIFYVSYGDVVIDDEAKPHPSVSK